MNRHKILCVDDEPSILSSLKRDLRNEEYEVVTAASGEEAIEVLRREGISLVISDERMPSMSGIELLQKVRDMSPDSVRILLTGHLDVKTALEAINKGEVYRYLLKPWDKEDLLLTVRQGLEKFELVRLIREQRDRLVEINMELSREKAMVSAIINAMGEGLIVTNGEGKITFVNRALEKLLMKSEDKIIGKKMGEFFETSPRSQVEHPKESKYYLKIGTKNIPVMVMSSPLINENGTQTGTVNAVRDVSAEQELEQRKADFFAMIVHDLRSPLISNIYGGEILKRRLKEHLDENVSEIIDRNTATLQRALNLVNSLLDISRFESGKIEMKKEDIDINEILDISARSLGPMAETARISIVKETGPDIPMIKGDRELLIRMMINLIGNAIKFSPQGSDIRIATAAISSGVKVSISDKGPGIPVEKLLSIFDRYVQAERRTEEEKRGTGLGLSICKQVVEAHGGRITAENALGGGSIFTVELPG